MKKSELFNIIMDKTCELCEVRRSSLVNGSRIQAVVDARCIAVQFMRRVGLSNDDIALFVLREQGIEGYPEESVLRKKSRCIDSIYRTFCDRFTIFSFRSMSMDMERFIVSLMNSQKEETSN